jgi:hypothetical protein
VYNVTSNSTQKLLLPVATTLVNFGLVRRVTAAICRWMCHGSAD